VTAKVMIVDDHALFADALERVLERQNMDLRLVNTAGDALELAPDWAPDIALVDLGLPDMSGIELGTRLLELLPDTKVLAVTAMNEPQALRAAIKAGFHGFITKNIPLQQFVASIETALEGQMVIPHKLAAAAAGHMSPEERQAALLIKQLTQRELEVLTLLATGAGGEEIAQKLNVSRNTVRSHVQNILTKLQVHSRLEAVAFAARHNVVKVSQSSLGPSSSW
jgi:two-component system, NarL family, nitrate/nitrite response regulator NarL